MPELKKVFGIVSYFPDDQLTHNARSERLTKLLYQLEELWPTVDVLIIAQNWKDYEPPKIKNNVIVVRYPNKLTIIGARWCLRNEFLKRDYDYIILMDDDCIIKCFIPGAHIEYMQSIDANPNGFAFIKGRHWHTMDEYARAPLNLCAISRFILQNENFPDLDLCNDEALEDDVYAVLLHIKWAKYEFNFPPGIIHAQYITGQYQRGLIDPEHNLPSSWFHKDTKFELIKRNTDYLLNYIVAHGDLPDMKKWKATEMLK